MHQRYGSYKNQVPFGRYSSQFFPKTETKTELINTKIRLVVAEVKGGEMGDGD